MEKYIKCKQNELKNCAENYMKIVNDPTGNAFTNIVLDPLYTNLNTKFCSPSSTVSYINHLIDLPDAVYNVNQKCDSFEYVLKKMEYAFVILYMLLIIIFIVLYSKK
jgi:hypothetical protein